MTAPIFALTDAAAIRGGAKGGQYLQGIGETDLAKLTVPQFNQFCITVVAEAFAAGLDDYVTEAERPPF